MYDMLCTANDNTTTLSHQTRVLMISHPLQAGQHSPCISHCTHCIYVITPSQLTSQQLLCDITTNFCVTSYELYITSYLILMSSHYSTYNIPASIYETTSSILAIYKLNMWHQRHYLCYQTHSIRQHTNSIFLIPTSPLISLPLLYDIAPTISVTS